MFGALIKFDEGMQRVITEADDNMQVWLQPVPVGQPSPGARFRLKHEEFEATLLFSLAELQIELGERQRVMEEAVANLM